MLIQGIIAAAMVAAIVADQPPSLVIGGGLVVSLLVVLAVRPRGVALSARVAHERLQLSLQWAMLQVMLADGAVDEAEAARAVAVHRELTNVAISEDAIRMQAKVALSGGDDLRGMLEAFASELTEEEKAAVLKGAMMVAVADGDASAAERPAVGAVAKALGLGAEDVRALASELSRGAA